MPALLSVLVALSSLGLVLGLIKPGWVVRWGQKRGRLQVLAYYGGLMLGCAVLAGAVIPSSELKPSAPPASLGTQAAPAAPPASAPVSRPDASKWDKVQVSKTTMANQPAVVITILQDDSHHVSVSVPRSEIKEGLVINSVSRSAAGQISASGGISPDTFTESSKHDTFARFKITKLDRAAHEAVVELAVRLVGGPDFSRELLLEKSAKITGEAFEALTAQVAAPAPAPAAPAHDKLKVGDVVQLTKQTSLMPELDPKDPAAALAKTIKLQPGAGIQVVEVAAKGGTPWYRVEVVGQGRTGWLNSIALMGQI